MTLFPTGSPKDVEAQPFLVCLLFFSFPLPRIVPPLSPSLFQRKHPEKIAPPSPFLCRGFFDMLFSGVYDAIPEEGLLCPPLFQHEWDRELPFSSPFFPLIPVIPFPLSPKLRWTPLFPFFRHGACKSAFVLSTTSLSFTAFFFPWQDCWRRKWATNSFSFFVFDWQRVMVLYFSPLFSIVLHWHCLNLLSVSLASRKWKSPLLLLTLLSVLFRILFSLFLHFELLDGAFFSFCSVSFLRATFFLFPLFFFPPPHSSLVLSPGELLSFAAFFWQKKVYESFPFSLSFAPVIEISCVRFFLSLLSKKFWKILAFPRVFSTFPKSISRRDLLDYLPSPIFRHTAFPSLATREGPVLSSLFSLFPWFLLKKSPPVPLFFYFPFLLLNLNVSLFEGKKAPICCCCLQYFGCAFCFRLCLLGKPFSSANK